MKYYAEFYHLQKREDGSGRYVEAVGDRSILRLDGRNKLARQKTIAAEWGKRHGFDGFRIARGENLCRLHYITAAVQPVEQKQ